jgi:xylulose-5-phosphate/fructose-6-phosphate phosphoketolase
MRKLRGFLEHTLEGWYEGYLLSGRHGFLSTYEPSRT